MFLSEDTRILLDWGPTGREALTLTLKRCATMKTTQDPQPPVSRADVEELFATLTKEVGDIVREVPKLADGDPANNAPAILEIAQSAAVIIGALGVAVATTVFTLQNLGVI